MKILFLYDGEYPWDIRVEKLCNSFMKNGHEVHMVCRNKDNKSRREVYNGIHLRRVSSFGGGLQKFNSAWTFPAFFSPVWLTEIYKAIKEVKFDLIVVRDLPMALSAVAAGKIARIPTLLDMAECYPEMLRCIWQFGGFKFRNIFLRNPFLADAVEMLALKHLDYVFVMIEESKSRLLEKGIDSKKIFIVSNTPDPDRFLVPLEKIEQSSKTPEKLKMVYVGLVNPSRGLDTTIEAVEKLRDEGFGIEFCIIGNGKDKNKLEKYVQNTKLQNVVKFEGWVDNQHIPKYINESDICIVPHHKCSHWDNTIPNKLFDYMAAKKPVIVSNADPMKRIVSSVQCGLSYSDFNVQELASKIKELKDPSLRERLGSNGRKAVEDRFNWAAEELVIEDALAEISQA